MQQTWVYLKACCMNANYTLSGCPTALWIQTQKPPLAEYKCSLHEFLNHATTIQTSSKTTVCSVVTAEHQIFFKLKEFTAKSTVCTVFTTLPLIFGKLQQPIVIYLDSCRKLLNSNSNAANMGLSQSLLHECKHKILFRKTLTLLWYTLSGCPTKLHL